MEISSGQVIGACRFGIDLLEGRHPINVDAAQVLRAILIGIATGEVVVGKPSKDDANEQT